MSYCQVCDLFCEVLLPKLVFYLVLRAVDIGTKSSSIKHSNPHFDLKYHYLSLKASEWFKIMDNLPWKDQVADPLTKPHVQPFIAFLCITVKKILVFKSSHRKGLKMVNCSECTKFTLYETSFS